MAASRSLRVVRGTVAASLATFIALLSHTTAGGTMPGWVGIAVPWVLAVMVSTLLAGRWLSLPRLALAVAVSQVLFHFLFVLGLFGQGSSQAGGSHGHHGAPVAPEGLAGLVTADAAMWIGHLAAGLFTVALLHRGERAVRRLVALAAELGCAVSRRLVALATVLIAPRPTVTGPMSHRHVALRPLGWSSSSLARRGPPLISAV